MIFLWFYRINAVNDFLSFMLPQYDIDCNWIHIGMILCTELIQSSNFLIPTSKPYYFDQPRYSMPYKAEALQLLDMLV